MMVKYFEQMFGYDLSTTLNLLRIVESNPAPEKPLQLLSHMLAAQQVWLNRVQGLPMGSIVLWPALGSKHPDLKNVLSASNLAWIKHLATLTETDLENTIIYQNALGETFNNRLMDIITQVLNHGTHHRAQIGQLLKAQGIEKLPITDYIFYVRNLN
jgi:uncharacterized damage-inducible protein DinB